MNLCSEVRGFDEPVSAFLVSVSKALYLIVFLFSFQVLLKHYFSIYYEKPIFVLSFAPVFPHRSSSFVCPVFPESRHNQMFLFLIRNPWQAHDTGYCCSCTFLCIIDDSGPSRQHRYTSNIDYHTVKGLGSLNFPLLNRKNPFLNNNVSRKNKFRIGRNVLRRTKRLPAVDLDSLESFILSSYF